MDNNELDFRDNSSLTDIQLQLSVSEDYIANDTDRQLKELNEILLELDKIPSFSDLFVDVKHLLKNEDRLNKMFYLFFIKVPKKQYKLYIIFTAFCDFFDLPYDKTYDKLAPKIKRFLDASLKKIIGSKKYGELTKKYKHNGEDIVIYTLDDL